MPCPSPHFLLRRNLCDTAHNEVKGAVQASRRKLSAWLTCLGMEDAVYRYAIREMEKTQRQKGEGVGDGDVQGYKHAESLVVL